MERTISKHFDDDEIIGRLPNGDLYLKPGVKRLPAYNPFDMESMIDEHINYDSLFRNYNKEVMKRYTDYKPMEGEIDDWDTE